MNERKNEVAIKMQRNMIDAEELIKAFIDKQKKEHPVYDDTSGSMTYFDIVRFIQKFAENH